MAERRDGGLLDIVRVLLLLQGAILIATTIEAAIWGAAFRAGAGPALISGVAAIALLVARARLARGGRGARRLVVGVETVILATLVIDAILAVVVRTALPPPVAVLTRLVLPLAVVILLRRVPRANAGRLAVSPEWGA